MRAILRDSFSELLSRKVLYIFGVITAIGLLFSLASHSINIQWQGENLDFRSMNDQLGNPFLSGYNTFMSFLVFLVVMITAGEIPGMLIKGRADYYLSKPMSRRSLLLSKAFAIWVVYGGLMILCVIINYIFGAALFGLFDAGILYVIAMNMLGFAIWLSVTTIAGVITGSTGMTIMSAFLVWGAQWVLSWHEGIGKIANSDAVRYLVDTLYYIVPKTGQIVDMTKDLATGFPVDWLPLWSSLAFAALMFMIATDIFKRKDY